MWIPITIDDYANFQLMKNPIENEKPESRPVRGKRF
jgi:hypothetical protein